MHLISFFEKFSCDNKLKKEYNFFVLCFWSGLIKWLLLFLSVEFMSVVLFCLFIATLKCSKSYSSFVMQMLHSTKNSYQKYTGIFQIFLRSSINKLTLKEKYNWQIHVRNNFMCLKWHIRRLVRNLALWKQIFLKKIWNYFGKHLRKKFVSREHDWCGNYLLAKCC